MEEQKLINIAASKQRYIIQLKLFGILTSSAVLIIFTGMVFCIAYIHKLKNDIVDEAITTLPLNIEIMMEG